MRNQILSVRIPNSLFEKLKDHAVNHHYMDVSEVVRTLLRKKCIEDKRENVFAAKNLKKDILKKIGRISDKKSYHTIIGELDKIKDDLMKKVGDNDA